MADSNLERKIDRLLDKLDANVASSGRPLGGTNTPTSAFTGDVGALFEKLGSGLKSAINIAGDLTGKAIDNTATVSDATSAAREVLKNFGAAGGVAGDALQGLSNILTESISNWQAFSDAGLNFGGNALALNEAVKKTGMSFAQYESILDKTQPSFANFGMGLNRGAEIFGEVSNRILNDPGRQRAFNMLGMNTKEVNEALATVVRGAGLMTNVNDEKMKSLIDSAVKLGKEMDAMAKLTGVSRKEQEKAIEEMQRDEKIRAGIVAARMENPEAEGDIGEMIKQAGALDPATRKLLAESIGGRGIMSSEEAGKFQQVYGAPMERILSELGRDINSRDADVRKAAIEKMQDLPQLLAEARKVSANFVRTGAVSNEYSREAFSSDRYENVTKNMAKYIKDYGEIEGAKMAKLDARALSEGKLIADYVDATGKTIKAERDKDTGEWITDDPRMKTTQIVTDTSSEIKRFGVALNEIITELNKTITSQRDKNGKLIVNEVANKTAGYNKEYGSRIKDMANVVKVEISALGDMPKGWADTIGAKVKEAMQGREVGSKKATGNWFETGPKGILMGEGGQKEAVVPEDQLEAFINDMLTEIPGLASPAKIGKGMPNLAGILKNVPSKVSSAQENTPVPEEVTQVKELVQDKVADKLDEISNVLAANLAELKNISSHTRDAATNTKDIGGYIS